MSFGSGAIWKSGYAHIFWKSSPVWRITISRADLSRIWPSALTPFRRSGAPAIGTQLMLRIFELVLTTAGVIWLDPRTLWPAISCAVVAIILPLFAQPIAAERDLRFRTHSGALCRFYFDALRGLMPVWTHRADHALQLSTRVCLSIGCERHSACSARQ